MNFTGKYSPPCSLFIYLIISFYLLSFAFRCEAAEPASPPLTGNFSLPPTQQPGPLISFGQNVLNKNEMQLLLFADDSVGIGKHYIDAIPGYLYGLNDNLSIFINAPIAADYQVGNHHSSGFEDAFAQIEYAFYNGSTASYMDQATIVFNVTGPTGSARKNPATGIGSVSYFLGTTISRMYNDWFVFMSPGAVLTTSKNGNKTGNSYLYQFGFGDDIVVANGWIAAWMLELDGTYSTRDRANGITDPDSGGNIVYATPSLWIASKNFLLQLGAGAPVTQNLYGNQTRETYLLAANIAWSIY